MSARSSIPSLIGTETLCRTPTPYVAGLGVQSGVNGDGLVLRGRAVAALSLDRSLGRSIVMVIPPYREQSQKHPFDAEFRGFCVCSRYLPRLLALPTAAARATYRSLKRALHDRHAVHLYRDREVVPPSLIPRPRRIQPVAP